MLLYNQPGTVAVIICPDGSHAPCYALCAGGQYWCGGLVDSSPDRLAQRIYASWYMPEVFDTRYEREEKAFTERERE